MVNEGEYVASGTATSAFSMPNCPATLEEGTMQSLLTWIFCLAELINQQNIKGRRCKPGLGSSAQCALGGGSGLALGKPLPHIANTIQG